jgi:membrane protein implicated in regulation of membrane protease activity
MNDLLSSMGRFFANEWDGFYQRVGVNVSVTTLGILTPLVHAELNMWLQTTMYLSGLIVLIWNFWGAQKEMKRKQLRDEKAAQEWMRVAKAESHFPKRKPGDSHEL